MKATTLRNGLGILFLGMSSIASAAASTCGVSTGEALYSANFQWKSPAGATKTLKLVIARAKKPRYNETRFVAKILNQGACEAICRADGPGSRDEGQDASVDLSCRSMAFGALAAPATVFFKTASGGRNEAVLRLGTWLSGYEQAVLTAKLDHSARLLREMAPEPVKLARSR